MRAMILAAGRGERMRPLTDRTPKPLLPVGGKPLITWQVERLVAAGIRDIAINHAWLGEQIEAALGDGSALGARITWSREAEALETAGGIATAMHALRDPADPQAPFAVVNGDVWCDFDYAGLPLAAERCRAHGWDAWCLLVPNPEHNPRGDFALDGERLRDRTAPDTGATANLTFSGIGVYTPRLFDGIMAGTKAPLAPRIRAAIAANRAGGARHAGRWVDVGTPERLAELDRLLAPGA